MEGCQGKDKEVTNQRGEYMLIIEQLIYIIITFALFVYMFFRFIKKNDTKYVPILAIQATGIGIDFLQLYIKNSKMSRIIYKNKNGYPQSKK